MYRTNGQPDERPAGRTESRTAGSLNIFVFDQRRKKYIHQPRKIKENADGGESQETLGFN